MKLNPEQKAKLVADLKWLAEQVAIAGYPHDKWRYLGRFEGIAAGLEIAGEYEASAEIRYQVAQIETALLRDIQDAMFCGGAK